MRKALRMYGRLLRCAFIVVPVFLAGCVAVPGRLYWSTEPVSVEIGGREYRVWSRRTGAQGQVQVVRMGYVPRSGHADLRAAMITAAEQATGCRVALSTIEGDTGLINARLRCEG